MPSSKQQQDRLFQLVAALANLLDRGQVVATVENVLGIKGVSNGDCVVFDDIEVRFGADGRVKSVYRVVR